MLTLPTTPQGSGNPVLDELDGLSPHAKSALSLAHQNIAGMMQAPGSMEQPATPAPLAAQPVTAPAAAMPSAPAAASPSVGPAPIAMTPQRAELGRLTSTGPTGQTGIAQIHNPWARVPLQIADAIGGGLFPSIERLIPGTAGHHSMLVNQSQNNVGTADKIQSDDAQLAQTQAQTANELVQPELNATKNELATTKIENAHEKASAQAEEKQRHNLATENDAMRKMGYKLDEKGQAVAIPYEELSQSEQAVHDLRGSQAELSDANAALAKAKKENIPVQVELAQKRIQNAQSNQSVALQRLNLSERTFNARYLGQGADGKPLPGAMIAEDGRSVGTANAANVRPTGQERNKADLASSAGEQLNYIKGILQRRKDIFGPINGRTTDFKVWVGSQDPDAQRFRAARTIAGDHLAGVFGGRSEAALTALDHAIGQFKDNPDAAIAGVDRLNQANTRFIKAGTVHTAGSNAVEHPEQESSDSDMVTATVGGKTGQIHKSQVEAFKKKYPGAVIK